MTIDTKPHATGDADAAVRTAGPQARPAETAAHALASLASVLAGLAAALALVLHGKFDPVLAVICGAGLTVWAMLVHWIASRRSPVRAPSAAREVKPRRKRPPQRTAVEMAAPTALSAATTTGADASVTAAVPSAAAAPQPSPRALDLLAKAHVQPAENQTGAAVDNERSRAPDVAMHQPGLPFETDAAPVDAAIVAALAKATHGSRDGMPAARAAYDIHALSAAPLARPAAGADGAHAAEGASRASSGAHPLRGDVAESDFERVERLVKRLADNVNQLEAAQSAPQSFITAAAQGSGSNQQQAAGVSAHGPLHDTFNASAGPITGSEARAAADAATELAASISALKRANLEAAGDPRTAPPPLPVGLAGSELSAGAADTPPPAVTAFGDHAPEAAAAEAMAHAASERANILAALNAQRIDVFLEPILDLSNQRPEHYEVSISLRTLSGSVIDLAQAASDLSGTGLLPLIDQARIARASQIARRLAERGKTGAVFADVNGESLDDGSFQETFASPDRQVGAFPGQLVLSLPQAHVMTFTLADWHTLDRLALAGFRFAITDVTTLDMDFAALSGAGFVFARLDAESFLIGLPTASGMVPPADICRHLSGCGLALIVGGIVEDHQLARIFGFGVLFGQGQLFGGARSVKAQAMAPSPVQVAAE